MKFKVLSFVLIMIFAVTGVAFAMPKIEVLPATSEPALMLFLGLFLTGASFFGRKLSAEQRIGRNR
jgi:di/tricarboxylate transporter